MSQTIHLRPGWNAVFLELDPSPNDSEIVFSSVPVESVWMWNKKFQSIQYIQDPQVLMPEQPGWLRYYPPSIPESALTNLHIITGGNAFLIQLDGDAELDWIVQGIPRIRKHEWFNNSYNFVGFYINPAAPPTFQEFFASDQALDGQPVYELSSEGRWVRITNLDSKQMEPGHAYWMYCLGKCDYEGPFSVEYSGGRILDFADRLTEKQMIFTNETSQSTTITLQQIASETPQDPETPPLAGPMLYSYYKIDPGKWEFQWISLPDPFYLNIPANGKAQLRLGIRRQEMSQNSPPPAEDALYQGIINVTNSAGVRWSLPVTAEGLITPGLSQKPGFKLQQIPTYSHTGLWVGTATINQVSRPGKEETEPTASEFNMRLIVHYDGEKARLLQEAYILFREKVIPCTTPTLSSSFFPVKIRNEKGKLLSIAERPEDLPLGYQISQEPETCKLYEPCIFSHSENIPEFMDWTGIALRDGVPVPRRISSVAFGFREQDAITGLESLGDHDLGVLPCSLKFAVMLPNDDPLNPFLHRYHPDHDNMAPLGLTLVTRGDPDWMDSPEDMNKVPVWTDETYGIKRVITMESASSFPPGSSTPQFTWDQGDFGTVMIGGTYTEQISGLVTGNITIKGNFLLRKASEGAILNPTGD